MAIIYEDIIPPILENTTMQKLIYNGVHRSTRITPVEGYVLRDTELDTAVIDPETLMPTGEVVEGYYNGTRSVGANYDFTENPRQFRAVLRESVPADQIFNIGNNDSEVM